MMLQIDCLDNVGRLGKVRSGDNAMTTRITRTEKLDLRLTAEAKHTPVSYTHLTLPTICSV